MSLRKRFFSPLVGRFYLLGWAKHIEAIMDFGCRTNQMIYQWRYQWT